MKENTITNEQAVRLAVSYAEYARMQYSGLETRIDIQLAISACRNLMKIQEEIGVDVVGVDRNGAPKLEVLWIQLLARLDQQDYAWWDS